MVTRAPSAVKKTDGFFTIFTRRWPMGLYALQPHGPHMARLSGSRGERGCFLRGGALNPRLELRAFTIGCGSTVSGAAHTLRKRRCGAMFRRPRFQTLH